MANYGNTIKDVALKAGVSISTVSKAFSNHVDLSEKTRARVLTVAAEMHYTPNALIRSLRQGNTRTVGFYARWGVHPDTSTDITGRIWHGIADELARIGYDALYFSGFASRTPDNVAATFLDGRVDAMIMAPGCVAPESLVALVEFGLPAVVIYDRTAPKGIACVTVDNRAGTFMAMDHLFALGHRRIAFYAPYFSRDFEERLSAYREAFARRGVEPDPAWILYNPSGQILETDAAERLIASDPRPTALVTGDDNTALKVRTTLLDRGLSLPGDMSITGFDDVDAAGLYPGLTTIRQPAIEVGKTAAAYVGRLLKKEAARDCRTELPVELVVRASTCPPT